MYKLTSKILLYNDTDLLALFDTHDEDMIYNSIISRDILIQVVYPLILWYIMNNIVYKAESANIACVIKLVEAPVNPSCHSICFFFRHQIDHIITMGKISLDF